MTLAAQPVVIVRAEEALIVVMVLVLWVAAIALFFNRWGKIRMLEPYQPKFIQQHRPSCPAALADGVQQQHSFSKFNINGDFLLMPQQPGNLRPRQNSVFVGSSMVTLPMNPPRKVKSAFDLQNLVLSDPALNRSIIRLNLGRDEIRRSSILPSFERAQCYTDKASEIKRPESRNNSICSGTRRSSIFPDSCRNVLSVDSDRTFQPPPIKSGVLDFRRNSMMIINNLAEEITPSPLFARNFSIGGSNVNLVPAELPSPRRNSVIPPYVLPKKPKLTSMPNSTEKYITNQKPSKSLDSEVVTSVRKLSPAVSELKRQFLNPIQTNSSESLATADYPKIIETRCHSPIPLNGQESDQFIFKASSEDPSSSRINLLANDEVYYGLGTPERKITSHIPLTMTSSLTDLNPRSSNNIITTTDTDNNASFKVTNV